MQQAFVGIDVGTSSARAGIFDENGTLLATARHPITVWHEAGSVVAILGTLNDGGTDGDAVAGDRTFTTVYRITAAR